MKRCITFGNWNKNYLYIIGSSISIVIYKIISGYNYYEYKFTFTLGEDEEIITSHFYVHQGFYYFIIFVFSCLFHIYELKRDKINSKQKNDLLDAFQKEHLLESGNSQDLIYNNIYEYPEDNKKISDFFAFIIILLYVLVEQARLTFKRYFVNCDFWMLELIIMAFLNMKMFKVNIYKHQYIAIILVVIPVILKFSTIIMLFNDKGSKISYYKGNNVNYKYQTDYQDINELKLLFVVYDFLLPISILIYLLIITLKAYLLISIKKVMDLKYVSLSKILICYGAFGTFLLMIFSIGASFIPCNQRTKDSNFYTLSDYQCKVKQEENGQEKTYIENILLLSKANVLKHSLIIIFGGIAYGFYKLFVFEIVQYLTPIHASFSLPIYYFLEKLILIYNINNTSEMKYTKIIYFIDLGSDLAAIFEFLIYLEIIELNFYGFNENLRKNIIKRGKNDFKQYNKTNNDSEITSEISEIESNRTISYSEVYD